jgi:NAD(P)-dependent dehydrogenase (short-subunit alcohol dehydrogenase family)
MAGTTLITGTDKGLGRVLLNTYLVHGYRVFAGRYQENTRYGDSRNIGADSLIVVPLDISDPDSIETAAATIENMTDSIDLIINNAGIDHQHHYAPLEEIDIEEIPNLLNVNALGPLRVTKRFLPLLRKGEGKLIINISSEAARLEECTYKDRIGYCMSKTAVNMQSRILQNHLGEEGIKVLAIHPGMMQTDMGGVNADIPPIESARGIYDLSQRKWEADDPVFITYTGKTMKW